MKRHFSKMADEVEIDVEGDFDFKLESNGDIVYDANELPSKSANLLPEYTNPPWMLEQGWTLDNCMDEKSKATIEKMLQEEQYYLNGKFLPKVSSTDKPNKQVVKQKQMVCKKPWSKEEKMMFKHGLELFGRSWTKIAELIPGRTNLQVKNYAQNYLKCLNKEKPGTFLDSDVQESKEDPLEATLATVTTAQPTVPTTVVRIHRKCKRTRKLKKKRLCIKTSSLQQSKKCTTPHADTHSSSVESSGTCAQHQRGSSNSESEEIDVDIESVDTDNNTALNSCSTSPDSIYTTLLKSANCEQQAVPASQRLISVSCQQDVKTTLDGWCSLAREGCDEVEVAKFLHQTEKVDGDQSSSVNQQQEAAEMSGNGERITEKLIVNAVCSSMGELIEFPIPMEEYRPSYDAVVDEEKRLFSEFFEGRLVKTPERYLKIRNFILDSWQKCRPAYLNKTSVRPGLKNCGDVNCIGKIHAYLECVGAINFGCEQACYNHPQKIYTDGTKEKSSKELHKKQCAKMDTMRPRKRRIRDDYGFWRNEKEVEGRTIEHKVKTANSNKPRNSRVGKVLKDPFQLIACRSFEAGMVPFRVEIEPAALIVMDIHAHLFKTEVVGILGGDFCDDQGTIRIRRAVPCRSISTGIQCEMDAGTNPCLPHGTWSHNHQCNRLHLARNATLFKQHITEDSQGALSRYDNPRPQVLFLGLKNALLSDYEAAASGEIEAAHQSVLGWYHSHPFFPASPSVRDVESQLKYQEWFARGGGKYVSFIVSPYNSASTDSQICCLTVEEVFEPEHQSKPKLAALPPDLRETSRVLGAHGVRGPGRLSARRTSLSYEEDSAFGRPTRLTTTTTTAALPRSDIGDEDVPFQHFYTVLSSELKADETMAVAKEMAWKYLDSENRVELYKMYNSETTCLTKMISSIGNYMSDHPERRELLMSVERVFEEAISSQRMSPESP